LIWCRLDLLKKLAIWVLKIHFFLEFEKVTNRIFTESLNKNPKYEV
jgi:hypothetical protein